MKNLKIPRDPNQKAKHIVDQVTEKSQHKPHEDKHRQHESTSKSCDSKSS